LITGDTDLVPAIRLTRLSFLTDRLGLAFHSCDTTRNWKA
jgi:hypothetical protein